MKMREFIAGLVGTAAWPLAARAQQPARLPRIGILDFFPSAASADSIEPFQQGLRELGHIDGRNIHVEYHSAEQRSDLAVTPATDLVRREVDIIVAVATPAAHAAKNATTTVPIVMQVSDPLATGLVASLARPAKLAELAMRHRLPMVAEQRAFVAAGGLAADGVNRSALSRRWAYYVDKILKGAKPADLPIELPTTFELVINLKTAKALGLVIPPTLLARAAR